MTSFNGDILTIGRSEIQVLDNLDFIDLQQQFGDYIDASQRTRDTYLKALKQFLIWLMGEGIQRPTREDVKRYRDEYLIQNKKMRATSVNAYLVAVRQFFAFLESKGVYKNIADHIKGKTVNRAFRKDWLSADQSKTLLTIPDRTSPKGKRDYALLCLLLTAGLRTIEAVRANIEDIDRAGGKVRFFVQGKGKEDRSVFVVIPEQTAEAIDDYLRSLPIDRRGKNQPIFQSASNNNGGGRMTTQSISAIVKGYLRKAGHDSERLTAHSLRHTAVTLARDSGQPLEQVQQFARHSNIQTTLIYDHTQDRMKNACSVAIADQIF